MSIFREFGTMAYYIWEQLGPTSPALCLIAIHINAIAAGALVDRMRGRLPQNPESTVEQLSRLGGIAQQAGLLGTVIGMIHLITSLQDLSKFVPGFAHAVIPTAAGIVLTVIAEGTCTYVLLPRRS
ncbi:MAG TPA: MotA/TolQ/ExbB proton channel family protein [Candidatus Polarisedimenticolia bacterium]|nr:MotA/TolQ/ExbB proton channel family protein [Candidatus Polarisedimenticolia bacterium]